MASTPIDYLHALIGSNVVAEIGHGFTVFGQLSAVGPVHLAFDEADLHSQHEANSTRDVYAIETRAIGIRPNRRNLLVPRERLLAICRLDDIVP